MISTILQLVLSLVVDTAVLWMLYLAIMALERANRAKPLAGFPKLLAYAVIAAGVFWDVLYNLTIGTVAFLDIPHEFTLSQRLGRLAHSKPGWRQRFATWIAENLLNPFSDGPHIQL